MSTAATSLSSQTPERRLINVALTTLHAHPLISNVMSRAKLDKLKRNIGRDGQYPPIVVRSHPEVTGHYQILDGHQRFHVIQDLGHEMAQCFLWDCDDQTALLLLATLNRLEGEDIPARRAELLTELNKVMPAESLGLLLPEDAVQIEAMLSTFAMDGTTLLAEITRASEQARARTRTVTLVLGEEDEADLTRALAKAKSELGGSTGRGQAMGVIARFYLEGGQDV